MQNIKKSVQIAYLKKNTNYKNFYLWTTRQIPAVKILNLGTVAVTFYILYQILLIAVQFKTVLYKDIMLLVLFILYIFIALPFSKYIISLQKMKKMYGNAYEIAINEAGVKIGQRFVPWKGKHKILKCKYGIAVLSFYNILILLPKDSMSDSEYLLLNKWI